MVLRVSSLAERLALERCDQRINMGVRKGQGENPLILLGSLDTIDALGHSVISALELCFRPCCPLESHQQII